MTEEAALAALHSASVADLGVLDADMVFGGYSRLDILEAMHTAESCVFAGPHFTVTSTEVQFLVYFDGNKIDVAGMSPRRKR